MYCRIALLVVWRTVGVRRAWRSLGVGVAGCILGVGTVDRLSLLFLVLMFDETTTR